MMTTRDRRFITRVMIVACVLVGLMMAATFWLAAREGGAGPAPEAAGGATGGAGAP